MRSSTVMDELVEQLAASLIELGPTAACTLAAHVRRRRADVDAALAGDPRFHHTGSRRASRWHLTPTGWTLADFARRCRISLALAEEFVEGNEGFLALGLVRCAAPGHYETTAAGLAFAARMAAVSPEAVAA